VNPFGIHETGPALPFAKTLSVNSVGIHENQTEHSARVGAGRRKANVKIRTLQKPKSAAPAKAIHQIPKQKEPGLRSSG
jgi:hypothetical protein